jgi:uncharacterized membrane protein (UPF0136 family)
MQSWWFAVSLVAGLVVGLVLFIMAAIASIRNPEDGRHLELALVSLCMIVASTLAALFLYPGIQ